MQVRSPGWDDPLEKEMATHSGTLVWKIPWSEKRGRLQSMGSQSRKINSDTVSTVSPSISHEVMGPNAMILVF